MNQFNSVGNLFLPKEFRRRWSAPRPCSCCPDDRIRTVKSAFFKIQKCLIYSLRVYNQCTYATNLKAQCPIRRQKGPTNQTVIKLIHVGRSVPDKEEKVQLTTDRPECHRRHRVKNGLWEKKNSSGSVIIARLYLTVCWLIAWLAKS